MISPVNKFDKLLIIFYITPVSIVSARTHSSQAAYFNIMTRIERSTWINGMSHFLLLVNLTLAIAMVVVGYQNL